MDLVTVTCLRDISDMERQAESIARFVSPCTHWVIVNEEELDIFKRVLNPYYKNHNLHLIYFSNNLLNKIKCGYRKQQLLKLYMAKILKEKYLVLDSKNFFIRQTNTLEYNNQLGSGILEIVDKGQFFYQTVSQYKELFNIFKEDTNYLAIQTPFVIDPTIITSFGDVDVLLEKIAYVYPHMSEFFLYSLLYENITERNVFKEIETSEIKHYTAFENVNTITEIIDIAKNDKIKVLALHRNYLKELSNKDIALFNKFLMSLGFKNLLKEKNV